MKLKYTYPTTETHGKRSFMKKFLLIFLSLVSVLTCALGLAACGEDNPNTGAHVHDWSLWNGDETHHWHECMAEGCPLTIGIDNHLKDGYGEHEFVNGICSVCSYEPTSGCKHLNSIPRYDENEHWQECIFCHERIDVEKHNFDSTCLCSVCNKRHSYDETTQVCKLCGQSKPTENLFYGEVNGSVYLTSASSKNSNIVIASEYNGKPVAGIRRNAFNFSCYGCTTVTMPDSIAVIEEGAFDDCGTLTSVTIPKGVRTIYPFAFKNCPALTIYCEEESKPAEWGQEWNNGYPVVWNCKNNEQDENGFIYAFIDGIRYALKNDTATVARQPRNISSANIPATVSYQEKTYRVTSIGEAAFFYCNLTEVAIPNSVTSIESEAFNGCAFASQEVTIPQSVNTVGNMAFCTVGGIIYCEAEQQPSGWVNVTSYSGWTYRDAIVIWNCRYNDKDKDGYAYSAQSDGTLYALKDGEATLFTVRNENPSVTISDDVEYRSVRYPVTAIGELAFAGHRLTEVVLPANLAKIGDLAFSSCSALKNITIPAKVTSIGTAIFSGCNALEKVEVAKDNAAYFSAGNCIIEKASKTLICGVSASEIPSDGSVTAIGNHAFSNCTFTEITLPEGITSIGDHAFNRCDKLTKISLPDSLSSIGSSAFGDCSRLIYTEENGARYLGNAGNPYLVLCRFTSDDINSFAIKKGTKCIGEYAFSNCGNLTNITVPDGVVFIGECAFNGCSFTEITIPDSVTECGYNVFAGCEKLKTASAPAGALNALPSALEKLTVTAGEIDKNALSHLSSLKELTIGASVNEIGLGALYGLSNLEKLTVSSPHVSIQRLGRLFGTEAFYGASATEQYTYSSDGAVPGTFYIPDSLKEVVFTVSLLAGGNGMFSNCANLTKVTLADGEKEIYPFTFYGCTSLKSFVIPRNVQTIGARAFEGCAALESIALNDGLLGIGAQAFKDCVTLSSVTVPQTAYLINLSAFGGCSALTGVTFAYDTDWGTDTNANPTTPSISPTPTDVTNAETNAATLRAASQTGALVNLTKWNEWIQSTN